MKEFTLEEIKKSNGKDGNPTLVVYKGRVIDVSTSNLWKGGLHMNRHNAGNDLSSDILAAPHTPEVLERYPQVGILKEEKAAKRDRYRHCWRNFSSNSLGTVKNTLKEDEIRNHRVHREILCGLRKKLIADGPQ